MVTRLQSSAVKEQANMIRGYFDQINTAVRGFPDFDAVYRPGWNYSRPFARRRLHHDMREAARRKTWRSRIIAMWDQEHKWMKHELEIAEEEMSQLQTEMKLMRRARSVLPFVGDAFKWAFGTSTEDDTRKLHQQIKSIKAGVGKLHHMIELQTTIIGALRKGQLANANTIRVLANETQRVLNVVIQAQDQMSRLSETTHQTMRQEADISQTIASAIRTTGAAVMTFRQEVHLLCEAMAHTQRGEVTPKILPLKALQATLTDIQRQLPRGWVLATTATTNPAELYRTLAITAVTLPDGWEAHIKVPLRYQPYGQFELYKVTPIPTHFLNSTAALETEIEADYFALSNDHRLHLNLKEEDIRRCKTRGSGMYCTDFTPLVREQRQGCLYDAFRGNTIETDKSCRRRITRPPPQLFTISANKWIYILPTAESFSLECVGTSTPTKVFRLQGTGVFTLPLGCSAIGDRYLIPPHLTRKSSSWLNITLGSMAHFEINLDVESLLTRLPVDIEASQTAVLNLLEKLPEDRQTDMTLNDLKKKVREWEIENVPEDTWTEGVIRNTNLTFSSVGAVIVIGITTFLCCRYRRRSKVPPATTTYVAAPRPDTPSQEVLETLRRRTEALEKQMKELKERQNELQRLL